MPRSRHIIGGRAGWIWRRSTRASRTSPDMRVFDWLRRAVRPCFRTRRRTLLTAVLVLATGFLAWHAVRLTRAHFALESAEGALARYDFAAAREHTRLAGDLRPRRPAIWLLAAQAARRDGDLNEAKHRLRRYKALAGDTPDGRLEDSLQQVQLGDIESDVYDLIA